MENDLQYCIILCNRKSARYTTGMDHVGRGAARDPLTSLAMNETEVK